MSSKRKDIPSTEAGDSGDLDTEFTLQEWQKDLREEFAVALGLDNVVEDKSALTVGEVAGMLNLSVDTAEGRLTKALKEGKMERVRVRRMDGEGRTTRIMWGYRPKKG